MQSMYVYVCHYIEFYDVWFSDHIALSFKLYQIIMLQKDKGLWTHQTVMDKGDQSYNEQSYGLHVTKMAWVIMRNSKLVKLTPIIFRQYLKYQLINNKTTGILEDKIKQFEDRTWRIIETTHYTRTANMKTSMQCNNGTQSNSDYTLIQNTMNTKQIDMGVNNIVNGEIPDSPNKGRQDIRHIADKQCETNI